MNYSKMKKAELVEELKKLREQFEHRQTLLIQVLEVLNQSSEKVNIIRDLLLLIKRSAGFEAVGIRLKESEDFPYYETNGFPDEFVEAERYLCARDQAGEIKRDSQGKPYLECMCGNVICGRTNASLPFFTEEGSFWSNCTTELLASTTDEERQARTRNRCNGEGYESVALIPLRANGDTIGLLQLNDTRKGQFTVEMIQFFEKLGHCIGIAFTRKQVEEEIRKHRDQLEELVEKRTEELQREITERKQAAEALASSEEFLNSVIEQSPASLWISDSEGTLIKMNQSCRELFGATDEEAVGKYNLFKDNLIEEQGFIPLVENVFEKGETARFTLDYDLPRVEHVEVKRATHRILDVVISPIKDKHGKVTNAIVQHKDVTERKKAEQARRQSEERYRDLVETTDNLVQSVSPDGSIVFVNRAWRETLGHNEEEIRSMKMFDIIHPDSQAHCMEIFQRVVAGEEVESVEAKFLTKDGRTILVEGTASCRLVDGKPVATYGIFHDVTERKEAEEALRKSEKQFKELADSMADAFFAMDRNFRYTYWNKASEQLTGIAAKDALGKSLYELFPDFKGTEADTMYHESLLTQQSFTFTNKYKLADEEHIFELTVYPFKDGLAVLARDVTERKKAEEAEGELEAQKLVVERMKELDRMKDEFISTVTHELRTPMTPLRSTIEMLLDGSLGELTDQQEKFIEMMARNVERLAQFTTEVLTLSRLESGRYKLAPRMLSLRETFVPVTELMAQKAQSKNSTVSLDIDAEISAYADADSLSIVVTNLTNNAIVHTPEGTAVTVSAKKLDGNSVEVSVADNGPGIPEEALENLFDRFYQAKRETGAGYKGTGVGLAVCKALVEAMGGKISVESRVGEGTVFKFTMPTSAPKDRTEKAKE